MGGVDHPSAPPHLWLGEFRPPRLLIFPRLPFFFCMPKLSFGVGEYFLAAVLSAVVGGGVDTDPPPLHHPPLPQAPA